MVENWVASTAATKELLLAEYLAFGSVAGWEAEWARMMAGKMADTTVYRRVDDWAAETVVETAGT